MNYKAGRARIEDELVDLLVADEALYLTEGATQELSYRLALRATVLANVEHLEMTRREVFDLMKSAYGVRSKIVHGDVPKLKDIKVKGTEVPLAQFVEAIERVIRDAVQEALRCATEPQGVWPPDSGPRRCSDLGGYVCVEHRTGLELQDERDF